MSVEDGGVSIPRPFNFTADVIDAWARKAPDKLALVAIASDGTTRRDLTFTEISENASRFANVLRSLGIERGDRVFVQMPRVPDWYAVVLGCFKVGVVPIPSATQLVANDIAYRLGAADCKVAISATTTAIDATGHPLRHRILVGGEAPAGWLSLSQLLSAAAPTAEAAPTTEDDPLLLYFTSGTTGYPKMVQHTHGSLGIGHEVTARVWHTCTEHDLHWTMSDFGWAKAAWGKLFGQWRLGTALFLYDLPGKPDYDRVLRMIGEHRITTFCAPPTVYRAAVQMRLGDYDFSSMRHCTAAGEPLNPEVISAWRAATGLTIYDGYGQTETVCIVCNRPGIEVRPGSMGKPMPGYDVRIVDEEGRVLADGEEGHIALAVEPRPIGLFRGYLNAPEIDREVFHHGHYYTGDKGYRDSDGYLWFVGRADDVILSAGYRIGPFEVESALISHAAVMEAAAVAKPDAQRGEIVCAFVVLAPGHEASDALAADLQRHAKEVTAPYKYPREIRFVDSLPKTISGKILRRTLRDSLKQ